MKQFFIKRLLSNLFNLWVLLTITFILTKLVPGDPFSQDLHVTSEAVAMLKKQHNLDQSIPVQYLRSLKSFFTWDYGFSLTYPNRTTAQIIFGSFPSSMKLGLLAIAFSLGVGVPLGIRDGMRASTKETIYFLFFFCIISAVPYFIIAALLQYVFAFKYSFFPISGWGSWRHMVLPVLSLSFFPGAMIARLTQVATKDAMQETYIAAAYAKGLSSFRIMYRHILPAAILPVVSYAGVLFAGLLTGSFIVETIFGIPGLGCWFVNSVGSRDYPVIMGLTVFYGTLLVSLSLITDLIYCLIDPRLRRCM